MFADSLLAIIAVPVAEPFTSRGEQNLDETDRVLELGILFRTCVTSVLSTFTCSQQRGCKHSYSSPKSYGS
jgi:hypothetical protein